MDIIQVKKEDMNVNLFKDVLFFMVAEGGAMGEMGAINFVKPNGKLYHLNYLWGDIKFEEVMDCFPTLTQCFFGICGIDSEVPAGWNYVNLGAGNHLIVSDTVYPQFKKLIENYKHCGEIYRDWVDHANRIINLRG